jgi:hypothetical protein
LGITLLGNITEIVLKIENEEIDIDINYQSKIDYCLNVGRNTAYTIKGMNLGGGI